MAGISFEDIMSGIDDTIDVLIIEEVNSYDLVQDT